MGKQIVVRPGNVNKTQQPPRHFKAMQLSQDEEYPWVDDNDDGVPLHHAEAEWTNLSTSFTTVSEKANCQ